ncbi:NifB/NifX family molybdenum-iron cluster-binding protein [Chloroflexota bacterium]
MKIVISSDGPNLESKVGHKLGTSQYLIIVDIESGEYEAVLNPGASGQRGGGIQAVLLAVSKGAKKIVTGYCSPGICDQLKANGIEVLTDVGGTVADVIEKYKKGELNTGMPAGAESRSRWAKVDKGALVHTIRSSGKQFINLLPILVGVVLLIGLFNTFISKDFLSSIFSGNMALDTIWGAFFGSIFA